jgi:molybdenum cofactor cytidylyltransferase
MVLPDRPPPDMKWSIQAALRHIELEYQPTEKDAFLVAPADMPVLSVPIINRLIERHASNASHPILTPTLNGKRGHPVLFPWPLAASIHALPPNEGLDSIVHRSTTLPIPCDDLVGAKEHPFLDIDTPDHYRAIRQTTL